MLLFEVSFQEVAGIAIVLIIGMIVYLLMELKNVRRELKDQATCGR